MPKVSIMSNSEFVQTDYNGYVTKRLSELSLPDALTSFAAIADRQEYIVDGSASCIKHAIEHSLPTLVENSSTADIKHAIDLNEECHLVDLSDLDNLLAPSHTATPAFNPSDYWVVEYNRNFAERNLKGKALTMELLNEIRSYVTTCYQNEEARKDVGFYFAHIKGGETVDRINIDGADAKQVSYEVLDRLASRLAVSQRLAQAQNHSLADDLQAAKQAATRQHTSTKQQTLHRRKL